MRNAINNVISWLREIVTKYPAHLAILLAVTLAMVGYFQPESNLQDVERVNLFNRAFQDGYISISQTASGEPLQATRVANFSELQSKDQELYGKERWERMQRLVYRFVTAVNQNLGDPFHYREEGDRSIVDYIKPDALTYRNPFTERRREFSRTPISSSDLVAQRRDGWRIVSLSRLLFLEPQLPSSSIDPNETSFFVVGGDFAIPSRDDPNTILRIRAEGQGKLQVLKVEVRQKAGTVQRTLTCRTGDYFMWEGHPYSVFRTGSFADPTDSNLADLVFTKSVNGKPVRVQVLGAATANLIGSPVGGEMNYIDGALLHEKVQKLTLTIDGDIQAAAFRILEAKLRDLDSHHASQLTRRRLGAVTVLDSETGQVLAQAGAPGFDPEWEGRRIILANRSRVIQNPANLTHMPGSSIKILTAGAGYVLFADGTGNMLPKSINKLAIMQAFRNSFGGQMPPSDILDNTDSANVTDFGKRHFSDHGGPSRLNPDFIALLNSGFRVLQYDINDQRHASEKEALLQKWSENLIPRELERYFEPSAKYSFFPEPSRFPIADTDSMEIFRMYAIGGSEARLTTLRLAAILMTVSSGKAVHPFIVESVIDPSIATGSGRVTYRPADVLEEMASVLPNVQGAHNSNVTTMRSQMTTFLQQVCDGNPGTGIYHSPSGRTLYMTQDDPDTAEDESRLRKGDFGKTGTADYGDIDQYDDSVFVYHHGRYVISVWLERADGNGVVHPANDVVDRIVRFIDRMDVRH